MIYDATAQEIDGILKMAAAAGSDWKGASSSLSPSTAQSLWRSVHSLHLRWPVLRNPDPTPAVKRALHNPAPSRSRENHSKNWVLVENEITTFITSGCFPWSFMRTSGSLEKNLMGENEQIVWYNFQRTITADSRLPLQLESAVPWFWNILKPEPMILSDSEIFNIWNQRFSDSEISKKKEPAVLWLQIANVIGTGGSLQIQINTTTTTTRTKN